MHPKTHSIGSISSSCMNNSATEKLQTPSQLGGSFHTVSVLSSTAPAGPADLMTL
jgi:hypothetical protein